MAQIVERYGKVVVFNKATGFGVIKEHRTKQRFAFHCELRVKVLVKEDMPSLGNVRAEGDINPRLYEKVIFTLDPNGGGVCAWAVADEFQKLAQRLPVMPIAIVKIGRKRFKVPRWQFKQMFPRWGKQAKDKMKWKFACRKTKQSFADEQMPAVA